jgi:MFS family permease
VLDTYRGILSYPGSKAFAFSGLLARLPISMFNISLILMVQIQYDSYEMAGRVAAIGVLVWALQTVPTARLTDRLGQRAAMIPLTVLFVTGSGLALWTAMSRGPEWMLWIAVAVASVSGPLGSLTRARWSHLLKTDQEIHSAFALEGALDEVLFIGGPALATILATALWPGAGLVVCTVGMLVGITILLAQKSTEPPRRSETGGSSLGMRIPAAVVAVTLISAGLGLMFGAIDISAVGFADESGVKAMAGVLIAALAAGSLTGGLLYGAKHWRAPLWLRTVVGAGAVALGFGALAFSPNLIVFGVIGFVAGATIAPTMTNVDTVVQRVVARDQITEGMAWVRIGLGIGVAGGAWAAGYLLDHHGSRWGLALAAGAGVLTFLIAFATIPWLKRGTERAPLSEGAAVTSRASSHQSDD